VEKKDVWWWDGTDSNRRYSCQNYKGSLKHTGKGSNEKNTIEIKG
jgi:hypothetical protein